MVLTEIYPELCPSLETWKDKLLEKTNNVEEKNTNWMRLACPNGRIDTKSLP